MPQTKPEPEMPPISESTRSFLSAVELHREGPVTVASPKSGTIDYLTAELGGDNIKMSHFLTDMWRLVQSETLTPVLRIRYPGIGTGDYHFLNDECCLVISRVTGGSYMENTGHNLSGWCALRFMVQGSFIESLDNQAQAQREAEGSFLHYGSGIQYTIEQALQGPLTGVVILFKPESVIKSLFSGHHSLLDELQAAGQASEPMAHLLSFQVNAELRELIRKILALRFDNPFYLMLVQSRTQELLALSLQALSEKGGKGANSIRFRETDIQQLTSVKHLLETDYAHHLTLEELARRAGLNRRKLTEGFKALFGAGVHEYLLEQRMTQAGKLLRRGMSVSDVSDKVGYQGHGAFSRAFKRYYGVSPRQFS
ncbi:helix-turn-helix transcriptional regulator [Pseudomaricurvus alkylphenolicus]|uniref:helix-turn-helix transcriptional regulator n=1 Tax=Pseudomaricurvus alkylphenolicus TaxID=1306991 RepID=UPI0014241D4F|nr:AraC family transcriptional regulator [Pseudomaricurvus alkylphenolicus]NIB45087.1 helix-turn-helix transcriptional regulator [Pseudomaricurvus alkylphenolicus]